MRVQNLTMIISLSIETDVIEEARHLLEAYMEME